MSAFAQAMQEATFTRINKDELVEEQSVPPYHMWNMNSVQTTGQTPDCTLTVKYALSSKKSSEDIEINMARS